MTLTDRRPIIPQFADDLAAVEGVVDDILSALPAALAGPCRRIALAEGKRSRPVLVFAAGRCAGGSPQPGMPQAAAVIELVHLAALVHDDLLEEAPVRRHVPTINAAEGRATALLAGDALLGVAGRLAATIGGGAAQLVAETVVDLCAGQLLEEQSRYRADTDASTVLAVARAKTGALTAGACRIGAALTPHLHPQVAAALTGFGYAFGTGLQLLDDLLDVVSSEEQFGKPVGVDFPAGVVTLPAVGPLRDYHSLRDLFRPGLTISERELALRILRAGRGIGDTMAEARRTARTAREHLGAVRHLGDPVTIGWLAELPERYLTDQLSRLVDPSLRHLLDDGNNDDRPRPAMSCVP